ncbi:MAG: HD domain-containing phosphohydrolase [Gemmatimonadota bacterium]
MSDLPFAEHPAASIIIVDDEPANVHMLERVIRRVGYANVRSTTDPYRVLSMFREEPPDVILLDLHMPGLGGLEVMRQLREVAGPLAPLVLVLTGDTTAEAKSAALTGGAKDFLFKPFDLSEVALRVHNLVDLRILHRQLHNHNLLLEQRVHERTSELEQARMEIIERLGMAAEYRDDETGHHTRRVGQSSAQLATALGLPPGEIELVARAAPLHDVGKIAVPDAILLKQGPLTPEEQLVMRSHTVIGGQLLAGSTSDLLKTARAVALTHHEHWDGGGYPNGLSGDQIPLAGRIVAITDVYDALMHDRPYRPRFAPDHVIDFLHQQRGKQFDPGVLDAFLTDVISIVPQI